MTPPTGGDQEWTIYVHRDDPSVLSISDGLHGDTLLRVGDGWRDQERAAKFVAHVEGLMVRVAELEQALRETRSHLQPEVGGRFDQHAAVAAIDAALAGEAP